ncbi:soluble scavenger receptor cysteine-rich domain-containing protein SSC5D-like [Scylla paramamosain]|uniref:soluble scavenger receptor cysteine-rich domain-containing protein SSC5D-like n=1 Tax=Scylla paramamosain TaxID=85552 RepID=UPI003083B3AD
MPPDKSSQAMTELQGPASAWLQRDKRQMECVEASGSYENLEDIASYSPASFLNPKEGLVAISYVLLQTQAISYDTHHNTTHTQDTPDNTTPTPRTCPTTSPTPRTHPTTPHTLRKHPTTPHTHTGHTPHHHPHTEHTPQHHIHSGHTPQHHPHGRTGATTPTIRSSNGNPTNTTP